MVSWTSCRHCGKDIPSTVFLCADCARKQAEQNDQVRKNQKRGKRR